MQCSKPERRSTVSEKTMERFKKEFFIKDGTIPVETYVRLEQFIRTELERQVDWDKFEHYCQVARVNKWDIEIHLKNNVDKWLKTKPVVSVEEIFNELVIEYAKHGYTDMGSCIGGLYTREEMLRKCAKAIHDKIKGEK